MESLSSPLNIQTYSGCEVREIWGEIGPLLMQALAYSRKELNIASMWNGLTSGSMRIWVIRYETDLLCIMVTEVRKYAEKLSCNIVAVAGEDACRVWREFGNFFRCWLEANAIEEVQATCRPSVARLLRPLGFKEAAKVMIYTPLEDTK